MESPPTRHLSGSFPPLSLPLTPPTLSSPLLFSDSLPCATSSPRTPISFALDDEDDNDDDTSASKTILSAVIAAGIGLPPEDSVDGNDEDNTELPLTQTLPTTQTFQAYLGNLRQTDDARRPGAAGQPPILRRPPKTQTADGIGVRVTDTRLQQRREEELATEAVAHQPYLANSDATNNDNNVTTTNSVITTNNVFPNLQREIDELKSEIVALRLQREEDHREIERLQQLLPPSPSSPSLSSSTDISTGLRQQQQQQQQQQQ